MKKDLAELVRKSFDGEEEDPLAWIKLFWEGEEPQEWELQEGWEQRVCEAVIQTPLAPREALVLLHMAGWARSQGYSFSHLFTVNLEMIRALRAKRQGKLVEKLRDNRD
jgi:hypothetical protein